MASKRLHLKDCFLWSSTLSLIPPPSPPALCSEFCNCYRVLKSCWKKPFCGCLVVIETLEGVGERFRKGRETGHSQEDWARLCSAEQAEYLCTLPVWSCCFLCSCGFVSSAQCGTVEFHLHSLVCCFPFLHIFLQDIPLIVIPTQQTLQCPSQPTNTPKPL